jgi:hypothetical protein
MLSQAKASVKSKGSSAAASEHFHVSWKHENAQVAIFTRFLDANRNPLRLKTL